MAAAGVDLVPHVEGGSGRLEHYPPLLLQAKPTHPGRGVEAACPGQYLPGDIERRPLVLELPDWCQVDDGAGSCPRAWQSCPSLCRQ